MTSGYQNSVIQFVYWYPPVELTENINSVQNVYFDSSTQLVIMQFNIPDAWWLAHNSLLTGSNPVAGLGFTLSEILTSSGQETIYVTPKAYTNWYNNNLSTLQSLPNYSLFQKIYLQMTSPQGTFTDQNQATAAFVTANNYKWVPMAEFSQNINAYTTNNVANYPPLVPVETVDTSELYALAAEGQAQSPLSTIIPTVPTWEIWAAGGVVGLLALAWIFTR